jgi:biopolymer transport protein ExbD
MLCNLRLRTMRSDSGPNMTPLVDVVMVILIFLMLAGSFGGAARFLVSKQGISTGPNRHKALDPSQPADINLDIHVENSHDGVGFVAQGTGIPPTGDAGKLTALLDSRLREFAAAGTKTSQLQVVLYPGRRVKYQYLIAIYQAALQAHFQKIAFATSH